MYKKNNRIDVITRALRGAVGLGGVVAVALMLYVYSPSVSVQAASTECKRQRIHTGPTLGDTAPLVYDQGSPHYTSMDARNLTSPIGSQNNTDVDMHRTMSLIRSGTQGNLASDSRSTHEVFMTMGMNFEAQANGLPTSSSTGVHEFTTPVRGLSFTVSDLDHLVNHDESFEIKVIKNDGSQITNLAPYHTINDSTSAQPTLTSYNPPGTYSTLGTLYNEHNSVDFAFPSSMEIKRVEIRYYWTSVPSNPVVSGDNVGGAIGYRDVTFDGPCIGIATKATAIGDAVQLDYAIKNIGGLALTAISLPVNLDSIFGAGNYTVTSQPSIVSGDHSIIPKTNFAGGELLSSSSSLSVGKESVVRMIVKVKNPAIGGDGKGNYSSTEQVTARPLAATAFTVSDDSVSGVKTDVNGNGDAADDTSPWKVALSSVATVPGTPKTGDIATISRPLQVAGFSTVALAPLVYLNRARLLARFKR